MSNTLITKWNWQTFAKLVAAPHEPNEHSPAAINRLIDIMDDYIVRVKGVKPQFKANNQTQMIDFQSEADREYYEKAYERYLAEKAKIESSSSEGSTKFAILVEFLKFRQAAELCRAHYLAKAMWESVNKHNQAAVCACNFKNTITKIVRILIEDYNVPREKISLIWGGAAVESKKQKVKAGILSNKAALDALLAEGITLEDLDLDDVEEQPEFAADIPPEYKLGSQNLKERQKEIDKFQRGDSLYCLFTFRAGGVGLSLHHTDELTTKYNQNVAGFSEYYKLLQDWNSKHPNKPVLVGKARRKESGYVVESDIPYIPTRQRVVFLAPTYSAIELVQGLGRCPRLTSLSDTPQVMVFFRGTIEERVAYIVSVKLRCLTKVVRQKEDWQDVCVKTHADQEEAAQRHISRETALLDSGQEDKDEDMLDGGSDSDNEQD